ncbi:MAG TPA: HAMP domain-containing sensor histidine kinase [Puia sp.]|nr:HAMP domain-containing sensor histidine kinase [Puia sp.]
MKLLSKLTLYSTLSKTVIVLVFILLLPRLVNDVASQYTNYYLNEQKKQVLDNIYKKGIDYYFEGDSSYGSYTMLKEEYISLEAASDDFPSDTIITAKRIVENDTLTYRLLDYVFFYGHKKYLLEIGKTLAAIDQYNKPLQRVALYALIGLVVFTLIFDLIFTRLVLRPLNLIIRTKLHNQKFPFKENLLPIRTSTTDFKYLDNSLIDLMNKIKEAFEKEREFTSNASHELMTPISILQNKIENLMVDSEMTEETVEKIMGMMNTLNRLKKIVRSLLLISRIENDQFVKTEQVKPFIIIQEIITELDDRLEARKLRLRQSVSQNMILNRINRVLIFQLFYNLINNAIRYNNEEGEIEITDQLIQNQSYTILIKDTGVGIHKNEIETIFNRFKKSSKTEGEGYGLGLSIVKSIAQYHNIGILVQSERGEGSVFSIVFSPEHFA